MVRARTESVVAEDESGSIKRTVDIVGKLLLFAVFVHTMPMTHGQVSNLFMQAQDAAEAQWESISSLNSVYYCRDFKEYKQMALDEDGYFFCDEYVDYAAACNANDDTSCNNRFAVEMFNNFQRALNVYSCSTYSQIWTCANCSDAYKRWLCSQVYRKMYLPDTDYTEEGWVGGFDYSQADPGIDPPTQFSYTVACSTLVPETEEHQIRLCNGWSGRDTEDLVANPENVCGGPAGCNGNLFLDPEKASAEDGFYVGSKIEILSGPAIGQWAEIQVYSGASRIAMFDNWQMPQERDGQAATIPGNAQYRVFLSAEARGRCRDVKEPSKRLSSACELGQFTDGTDTLPYLPNKFMGGSRCKDSEQCMPVAKRNTDRMDPATGLPLEPDTGYVCCPKDGRVLSDQTKQEVRKYSLKADNLTDGTQNFTCLVERGTTADTLSAPQVASVPTPAVWAYNASGCTYNFSVSSEIALDFCALKTCFPVCHDVMRRCPVHLEFNCPTVGDKREYDYSTCNIMLAHGCSMKLTGSSDCTDLNLYGYGPLQSDGTSIFGLPPGAGCRLAGPNVGLVGIEPPQPILGDGDRPTANIFWEEGEDGSRKFSPSGDKTNDVCSKKQ